jgi:hypothetical protein
MSYAVAVQLPLRESNFCGESEPDNHCAPLEQSREPRRQCAGRGSRRDRNNAQPHENLGPIWAASLSAAAAIGTAGPSITISPSSVDTPELFTYRGARPSCIRGMEIVEPREQVGWQGKYENTLLSVQPSIVNLGGTAVS